MKKISVYLLLALMLIAVVYYLVKHNEATGNSIEHLRTAVYTNTEYGYSFSYDTSYKLEAYVPQYVSLYDESTDPRTGVVDVSVDIANAEDGGFDSYESYIQDRAKVYCAADGPHGSLRCTKVTRKEPINTALGLTGTVFYLELEARIGTTTTMREVGPFYAFDVSQNVPESRFAVLLIRPTLASSETPYYGAGAALAQTIVNSLRIQKK